MMVGLVERDKMTDNYFLYYLSVFAASRAVSSATGVWKELSLAKGTGDGNG